jgi:superfamily I DNA/RNA helicase
MTKVIRYIGAAGSGKSTRLLEYIEEQVVENSLNIEDILFISFTRSQISDIKARIHKIFKIADEKTINSHVRTIHGAALSIFLQSNLMPHATVITESKDCINHYMEFCSLNHMMYESKYITDEMETDPDFNKTLATGNCFFKINSYMTTCMLPISEWSNIANKFEFEFKQVESINEAMFYSWKEFKKARQLVEHDDYIQMCIDNKLMPYKRKLLLLDEMQDVSTLQYRLYEMWRDANVFESIYIAGDENQAIYSFRGSDPKYIVNEKAIDVGAQNGKRVKSFRNPSAIVNFADKVLGHNSHGDPAYIGGRIEVVDPLKNDQVIDEILNLHKIYGKVVILSRIKRGCTDIHNMLNYAGIPHTSLTNRYNTWTTAWITKGGKKSYFDMGKFINEAYTNPVTGIKDLYNLHFAWGDEFLKKIYFKAIKSGKKINPNSIVIDTIHASKGLEWPAVIIYDMGFNPAGDLAEEHRIYYVAVTRSSNQLTVMLSPKAKQFSSILSEAMRS